MSSYKDKASSPTLLSFSGSTVAWLHTILAYSAFIVSLVVGCSLHYEKIVQNQWFGYPQEWFPSVSATIGDRYPERSFFMVLIALTSGPRFVLVGLWYLLTRRPGRSLPDFVGFVGFLRTFTCGGWTYVTSSDNHDWHDIFMIAYLIATLPWMFGCISVAPASNSQANKYRKRLAGAFFGTLVPLVYFFIQHKVYRVPGAYTIYAFFEWSLILFDVAFDAISIMDFQTFEISIKDVNGSTASASLVDNDVNGIPSAVLEKEVELKEREPEWTDINFTWTSVLDSIASVYHAYIFWTILTSLGMIVWYFPLWHMGISGYEAFVMSTISPFLLASRKVRVFATKHQRLLNLLSLVGIAAYQVTSPELRLLTVGIAVSLSCLNWVVTLTEGAKVSPIRLEDKVTAWILGLLMASTSKFGWWSNNPLWPIMHAENGGYNFTGLVLAVLAALQFTRNKTASTPPQTRKPDVPVTKSESRFSLWLSACGVGGVFFGLHSLLSDTGTMILWVWDGYPVRGPQATTHGYLIILAMTLGLAVGLYRPKAITNWISYTIACSSAYLVTMEPHWKGFYGALTLAFYLPAISIPIISRAAHKNPVWSFGLGFLIYNAMVLFHVWVVAYAFVPGGPLFREHTDWIMASLMLQIGAGVLDLWVHANSLQAPHLQQTRRPTSTPKRPSPSFVHRRNLLSVAGIINLVFLFFTYLRFPTPELNKPYHAEDRILTAGIWTIHFSLDNDMWSSEYRLRDLIREMEVDVIGLLESDLQRVIMGNRDTTQFLAEDLGMYVDYGPGPNKHTWGAALLSKFPIVNSTHHLLPSPVGELAPAIHATLDVYGELVDVFVFHSGQEEDKEDRRLQSLYMAKLMGSTQRPAILLSYLVTKPHKGNYRRFYVSKRSGMHDVDPTDKDRWCEYILYKGLLRTGYARVSRSTITDTELQVAKFHIPPPTSDEKETILALTPARRNQRVEEDDVPEGWRFPARFRGEGVRDHRYHVFDEPRYYHYTGTGVYPETTTTSTSSSSTVSGEASVSQDTTSSATVDPAAT